MDTGNSSLKIIRNSFLAYSGVLFAVFLFAISPNKTEKYKKDLEAISIVNDLASFFDKVDNYGWVGASQEIYFSDSFTREFDLIFNSVRSSFNRSFVRSSFNRSFNSNVRDTIAISEDALRRTTAFLNFPDKKSAINTIKEFLTEDQPIFTPRLDSFSYEYIDTMVNGDSIKFIEIRPPGLLEFKAIQSELFYIINTKGLITDLTKFSKFRTLIQTNNNGLFDKEIVYGANYNLVNFSGTSIQNDLERLTQDAFLWDLIKFKTPTEAYEFVEKMPDESQVEITLLGFTMNQETASFVGPILIILMLVFLRLHLENLQISNEFVKQINWIPLFIKTNNWPYIILNFAYFIAPIILVSLLFYRFNLENKYYLFVLVISVVSWLVYSKLLSLRKRIKNL